MSFSIHDIRTGLRAIVAIHSTALGPAAGGCRMWPYASSTDAATDVLRLSRGMSYKNAMAGHRLWRRQGGDHRRRQAAEVARSSSRPSAASSNSLGGRYVTAEDVGTTTADMESVARQTRYVSGLDRAACGDVGGDPGPKTALGVYLGIKAAVKFRLGRSDLQDVRLPCRA